MDLPRIVTSTLIGLPGHGQLHDSVPGLYTLNCTGKIPAQMPEAFPIAASNSNRRCIRLDLRLWHFKIPIDMYISGVKGPDSILQIRNLRF